jgi:NAD(P)-dependent dehydrogenase (short-subunit alcohol dehydrogenase family)
MSFIYRNKFSLPSLPPKGTFDGQTILITGATGGLGLMTAVHFVNLGASSVIITARSAAKGETAKASIESQTGTKNVVKVMILDMNTFAGTKDFAERVKKEVNSIDYLLLNAGILTTTFKLGQEGFEETMEINCITTTLLALLLLPWLKEIGKGKAHLGFVTSGLHRSKCFLLFISTAKYSISV